jgi:hypothetical protein
VLSSSVPVGENTVGGGVYCRQEKKVVCACVVYPAEKRLEGRYIRGKTGAKPLDMSVQQLTLLDKRESTSQPVEPRKR